VTGDGCDDRNRLLRSCLLGYLALLHKRVASGRPSKPSRSEELCDRACRGRRGVRGRKSRAVGPRTSTPQCPGLAFFFARALAGELLLSNRPVFHVETIHGKVLGVAGGKARADPNRGGGDQAVGLRESYPFAGMLPAPTSCAYSLFLS
jgi:hypothetical protein